MKDIQEELLKQIEVPKKVLKSKIVFCPVGLVGAGKTTVTKPVAKALGLVRLSSDEARKIMKEKGLSYSPLKEIMVSITKKFIDEERGLALDMDCGNPETKEMIGILEKEHGYTPVWVHINPSEDFILNKLRAYKHTWLFIDGEDAVENYFRQKETRSSQEMPKEYFYVFDTGRADIKDQIDECVTKIKAVL